MRTATLAGQASERDETGQQSGRGESLTRELTRRFYLAIGLLVLLFLTTSGLLLAFLDRSLDRQAIEQGRSLARTALSQVEGADRHHAYEYAYWDETAAYARGERDDLWADQNIGLWSLNNYNFAASFLVSADDRLAYSLVRDRLDEDGDAADAREVSPESLFGAGVARLIEQARAAPMAKPEAIAAYFRLDGAIYLLVAAAVTPEGLAESVQRREPRPVLLYAREIDHGLLHGLSERYLLPELRLEGGRDAGAENALALRGPDGAPVAALAWTPTHPGIAALRQAMVPGAVGLLLLAVLTGALLRTAWHSGRTIAETVAALELSNRELAAGELAARRARDEAERANRIKSVFLANVSHELRTPLNAILGFSDIMRHQLKGPIGNNAYRGYADDIHASGQHLLRLIDNVIDLSRIETGAWELDPAETDLRGSTEEVLRFLQPLARQAGVELEVDLAAAPASILADCRALAQIVTNLVGNAIKFTGRNGRVSVSWRSDGKGGALLEVADTGVGISASDLEAIILPFERGRDPATRRCEGSGLGLAIVKSLVDLHGGRMAIDSAPGRGTRVTVLLPGHEEAAAA